MMRTDTFSVGMKQAFESLVKCLALDPVSQTRYLQPIPAAPVQVCDPEIEILTQKPLLIVALIVRTRPYSATWWNALEEEQKKAFEALLGVITVMLELGVWAVFSDNRDEQEVAREYLPVWEACRILAANCISKANWVPGPPKLPFELLLQRFTATVPDWPENMVR
jgi:hypothetical protein